MTFGCPNPRCKAEITAHESDFECQRCHWRFHVTTGGSVEIIPTPRLRPPEFCAVIENLGRAKFSKLKPVGYEVVVLSGGSTVQIERNIKQYLLSVHDAMREASYRSIYLQPYYCPRYREPGGLVLDWPTDKEIENYILYGTAE